MPPSIASYETVFNDSSFVVEVWWELPIWSSSRHGPKGITWESTEGQILAPKFATQTRKFYLGVNHEVCVRWLLLFVGEDQACIELRAPKDNLGHQVVSVSDIMRKKFETLALNSLFLTSLWSTGQPIWPCMPDATQTQVMPTPSDSSSILESVQERGDTHVNSVSPESAVTPNPLLSTPWLWATVQPSALEAEADVYSNSLDLKTIHESERDVGEKIAEFAPPGLSTWPSSPDYERSLLSASMLAARASTPADVLNWRPHSNCVEYLQPGVLFAFFALALISVKQFRNVQRPRRHLHESYLTSAPTTNFEV
eukprot:gnl/TRDRNA2_/TRDRNA2_38983_c0_seq1.p1 gnl/TRDRNA2_/TRDRNA2_38983_c0~~gnl/TRDRNA2_/TRDRNA2_38983_c0_seq1.p1  ORF type:complete len:312 (-),score=16.40 gnl/TRDRNA2_/TRDRNA2_38983_c0_seq1:58-993(-)